MTEYVMESPPGARTIINGRWRDYFSGTGYLGLQGHPDLLAAAASALARYGLTTATSRGGYGEHPLYAAVEQAAARTASQTLKCDASSTKMRSYSPDSPCNSKVFPR